MHVATASVTRLPADGRQTGGVLVDIITTLALVFIGGRLLQGALIARRRRDRIVEIIRGLRWRHLWPVPLVLMVVLVVAGVLLLVPGLSWGWWTALSGSASSPVFGTTQRTTGTALEWLIPVVFLALLVPALPLFAEAEERMFRQGAEYWSRRRQARSCLAFGAAHALIGIPIAVAIALSLGGAYFMARYLRAGGGERGVLESTRAHTAYNAVIVIVAIGALASGQLR